MKSATKFSYTVNGCQTTREYAVRTFGENTISLIEATMDGFDVLRNMSFSATEEYGNRLTITKED